MPFRRASALWLAGLIVLMTFGVVILCRTLNIRPAASLTVFMLMPQSALAVYYGNFDAIVLASLAGALALARRSPYLAGAALSLTWLKPQVGLPFAMLVMLFAARPTLKSATGFCLASTALALASCVFCGVDSLGNWLHALSGYSNELSVPARHCLFIRTVCLLDSRGGAIGHRIRCHRGRSHCDALRPRATRG